jgi:CTP-dependent riboflavin kinase
VSELLVGRVQPGARSSAHWFTRFNAAYSRKLGMPVFPGTLNLGLDEPFEWLAPRYAPHLIHFAGTEYGGERDVLVLPCALPDLDARRAFLWTSTRDITHRKGTHMVELVCDVKLRDVYGLADGDQVTVTLPIEGEPTSTRRTPPGGERRQE